MRISVFIFFYFFCNRCLRQFWEIDNMPANNKIQRCFSSTVFKRAGNYFSSDWVKMIEGCIEAPLQLATQLFVIIAGNSPGKLKTCAFHDAR